MSVAALQAELQQLGDSYLLLQGAYWRQKEQLLELEVQGGQLKAALEQANTAAAQVGLAGHVPACTVWNWSGQAHLIASLHGHRSGARVQRSGLTSSQRVMSA